jgi:SAM-dependent methyltransferase
LLRENGLRASGIEQNKFSAEDAIKRGLNIEVGDMFDILAVAKSGTFGAVTAFHVIEHLDWKLQLTLMRECFRVLSPGGVIILEWPNIESLAVATNTFWFDPTHVRPLPHQLASFMLEYSGFTNIRTTRYRPLPGVRVHNDFSNSPISRLWRRLVSRLGLVSSEMFGSAMGRINELITPGRDISVVGTKPVA